MYNLLDNSKELAASLAALLVSGNDDAFLSHQVLSPVEAITVSDPAHPPLVNDRIGIWTAAQADGVPVYIRDHTKAADWRLWSNRHVIAREKKAKRILLLGESVARGYFYDPFYNPAMELQHLLDGANGPAGIEVVDLAKSGLVLEELLPLFESSLQLQPDMVVIFAGNNWGYSLASVAMEADEVTSLTAAYNDYDFATVKSWLEHRLKKLVTAYMEALHGIAEKKQVPILFVIPEFNLLDWKSTDPEKTAANLPGDATSQFLQLKETALQQQVTGDWNALATTAARLCIIDPSNPAGYEFLARCQLACGKKEAARRSLEQARDAVIFKRVDNHSPRCISVVQESIREAATTYGFTVVDLPVVFSQALNGDIPGKELFLDYCHLTQKGIHIAMQAVATALPDWLTGSAYQLPAPYRLDPEKAGLAHLFAASLNARFGQPEYVLQHLCETGVASSPAAAKMIGLYASFSSRKIATPLCKSYEQVVLNGLAEQYNKGTGLLHGMHSKQMDHVLVDCMANALKAKGQDLSEQIRNLRIKEHSPQAGPVDLLQSYYHLFSTYKLVNTTGTHYKAYQPASPFIFIAGNQLPLHMEITLRTAAQKEEPVVIRLNGAILLQQNISPGWKTMSVEITGAALRTGINDLVVEWPVTNGRSGQNVVQENTWCKPDSLTTLQQSLQLFPLFGEIHQFTIQAVKS